MKTHDTVKGGLLAVTLLFAANSATAEEIRLTCTGTAVSGSNKAMYPAKLSESIQIDTNGKTVNGVAGKDFAALTVSEVRIEFGYRASRIYELFSIDRITGRFVFGSPVAVMYEGTCRKATQAKQF